MGKKVDLSNFKCGMVDGVRKVGLSISQSAQLLGFSTHNSILEFTKNGVKRGKHPVCSSPGGAGGGDVDDARGQRRMGRLIQAYRRATLTEITRYAAKHL